MDRGAWWATVHVPSVYLLMAIVRIHSAAGGHRLSPLILPCVISTLNENRFFIYDLVFQVLLTFSKGVKPKGFTKVSSTKRVFRKKKIFPP